MLSRLLPSRRERKEFFGAVILIAIFLPLIIWIASEVAPRAFPVPQ